MAVRPGRDAWERSVLAALNRPPCGVLFSGGRDSSAVLAVAASVARREGLPLPVPITYAFPLVEESFESSWQELVVRHLELPGWQRLTFAADEFDITGSLAQEVFGLLGLVLPFNTHFFLPALRQVRGGSLLTGVGGDGLLVQRARTGAAWLLSGKLPRRALRSSRQLAVQLAPHHLRQRAMGRDGAFERLSWLTPAARDELVRVYAHQRAAEPINQRRALETWWRLCSTQRQLAQERALGLALDVLLLSPLIEPDVVAGIAAEGGFAGFGSRGSAMRALVGDLLPSELLERGDKATFDGAFWTPLARQAALSWNGSGLDPAWVDAERLQELWRSGVPRTGTFTMLQHLVLDQRLSS